MLELKNGRYFAAIAFVYGEHDRDWLGSVWRDLPDGPWILDGRFRFYRDDRAFNSKDEKKFYRSAVESGTTDERCLLALRTIADGLVNAKFNDQLDFVELRSSNPASILAVIKTRPWCHITGKKLS